MVTSKDCFKKYGDPEKENNMGVFYFREIIRINIPSIPVRIYCNNDLWMPLLKALENVIIRRLSDQIKTWDGCFNIRRKRGATSMSLHSWGIAIDINAAWNRFGQKPTMSKELVQCFKDAGFDWGGDWSIPDGMHFQLSKI